MAVAATTQWIFVPTKEEHDKGVTVFENASIPSDLFASLKSTSIKEWRSVRVWENCKLGPIVLNDPIKLSVFPVSSDQNFVFEDLEKDFVFDRSIDVNKRTIRIAARCIVICRDVHVHAKEIDFFSLNESFNFGQLTYEHFDTDPPLGYSHLQGLEFWVDDKLALMTKNL